MARADYSIIDPATARLTLRDDLIFRPQASGEEPSVVIEDPLRGRFFQVGACEYTFISLLDGQTSIVAAVGKAATQLGSKAIVLDQALAIACWLMEAGLVKVSGEVGGQAHVAVARQDSPSRNTPFNPLAIKLPLFNPDRLLAATLPWTSWLLSLPALLICCAGLVIAGFRLFEHWAKLSSETSAVVNREHWFYLAVSWLLLKVLHESGHAIACKKFGGHVNSAGLMFVFFSPVAFVDVTSSWRFASKWQRIVVAAAGMYFELVVAAVASLVWSCTEDGPIHRLALSVAVMASVATFAFNANPLMRFDGYFILSDLLGIQNLYSRSRQLLAESLSRFALGMDSTTVERSPRVTRLLVAYGLASLAWRVSLYVTIVLATISVLGYLGAIVAAAWTMYYVLLPCMRSFQAFWRAMACRSISWHRAMATVTFAAVSVISLGMFLALPGSVKAPAVVEYVDLAVIRAASPGIVRDVRVRSGEPIAAGQTIAILENKELESELSDLALALEQSMVKGRIHLQGGEQAKLQVENAQRESLVKRQAELQKQVEALTIRAPQAGKIVGRRLSSLEGQFLQSGEEIAVVGNDSVKELLVCVSQEEIDLLLAQVNQPVRVAINGETFATFESTLKQVNPRAEVDLPHLAFSALNGGSLAVKLSANDDQTSAPRYELLRPHFVAKIALTVDESARLFAGQQATISFRSQAATIGGRWYRWLDVWIHDRINQAHAG